MVVKQEFNSLPSAHQQAILTVPVFQARWVTKIAHNFDIEEKSVKQEIERISAIRNGELEVLAQEAEMETEALARANEAEELARKEAEAELIQSKLTEVAVIKARLEAGMSIEQAQNTPITPQEISRAKPQISQDYTLAQASVDFDEPKFGSRQRRTYTKFMTEITTALKNNPQGLTKSDLLSITRRSGKYRQMRDEILLYLQSKRLVRKLNNKFIHTQNLGRVLETDFHRKVYESLAGGPLTITGIVTLKNSQGKPIVGYNNTTGRRKVKQVLDLLWREGLVSKNTLNQYYIVRPEP